MLLPQALSVDVPPPDPMCHDTHTSGQVSAQHHLHTDSLLPHTVEMVPLRVPASPLHLLLSAIQTAVSSLLCTGEGLQETLFAPCCILGVCLSLALLAHIWISDMSIFLEVG